MASSRRKKRRTPSKKGAPLVAAERKQEVLGLVLMTLAALLSLAFVTYDPADNPVAQAASWGDFLAPGDKRASNALGLVGAKLAWLLVPNFLGYTVLLFTGLLGVWGYVALRRQTPVYLRLLSVLTLLGAFVLACLFGWLSYGFGWDLINWAGDVGLGLAGWTRRVFGAAGSFVLLLLLLAITALLVADQDIQRSLDRAGEAGRALLTRFQTWRDEARVRSEKRRQERARRREERRAEQEGGEAPQRTATREKRSAPAFKEAGRYAESDEPPRRLNDLFRAGWRAPASDAPSETAPSGDSAGQARPRPPQPARPPDTPPSGDTSHGDTGRPHRAADVTMEVQQQVEEEKADSLDRPAEEVDEDLSEGFSYEPPAIDLLDVAKDGGKTIDYEELEENKQILLDKLATYNVEITDIKAIVGPTVTLYELTPAPGVKVSRIKSLEDDLAMAMAAQSIRVIAPIPGKSAVGVEIPNRHRELVRLRDVIGTAKFRDAKMELPVPIGKSIEGEVFLRDLTKMPHLLIAGATGSGKSVGLNALVASLIYACHPANLKFVVIDPKKIELQQFALLEDHFLAMPENTDEPIITDFEQAMGVLKSCEKEMEDRYDLLAKASVRGIKDYNKKLKRGALPDDEDHRHMPYVVVVVDELADLMMTAGKEIEGPIARLAQMARAVGIHLVLATQRPSVDVITGLIKANFPSRMAYQVASRVDSRTILDQIGAEGLVGNGDLLYMNGSNITRLQGPFVSIDEIDRITEAVAEHVGRGPYRLPSLEESGHGPTVVLGVEDTDELFEKAARIIVRRQQGSVSLLQRKLAIGYTRAARIVDQLEEAGIVGPFVGTKARDVLVEDVAQLEALLSGEAPEAGSSEDEALEEGEA